MIYVLVYKERIIFMDLKKLFSDLGENFSFVLVCLAVAIFFIVVSKLAEKFLFKKTLTKVKKTKYITICAMLSALAGILMFFEFPLPFLAPAFYQIDLSELPGVIGSFYLGPVAGVIIEFIKVLVKLLLKGTSTAFVGDFANFTVGCMFVVPASMIYHIKKSQKTAIVSLATGTMSMTVFGSFFNAFYLLPTFSTIFGLPLDAIVDMGSAINGNVTSISTLVLFAVAPLNIIKGLIISLFTFLLYKHISRLFNHVGT